MTESRRRQRNSGPDLGDDPDGDNTLTDDPQWTEPQRVTGTIAGITDSVPAAEAEADAGTEAIWDAYDQTLAAAVRERDRALDKASSRLASVTAGGYLEYDRSVSVALAAFESAWHNARTAHAAVPR